MGKTFKDRQKYHDKNSSWGARAAEPQAGVWCYILARVDAERVISFNHYLVIAADEASAYTIGQQLAEDDGLLPLKGGEQFGNDYVVQVGR